MRPGVGVGTGTEARTKCDAGLAGSCGVWGRRPEEKTGHLLSTVCVVSGGWGHQGQWPGEGELTLTSVTQSWEGGH